MNYETGSMSRQIDESRRRAHELVSGLTAEQIASRPDPDKWSIAECLAHLNITAATVQKLMARGIEQAKQEKRFGEGPFSIGPKGRLLIWIAEPPPKFRIRAPKNVRPPAQIDNPLKLLPDFLKAQDEWERLIRESASLDLSKIKVGKLFSPFRARFAAAVPWMMAHQRRHLLQAEDVKRQIFSAASIAAMSTI
jgi:DinB superfamily